MPHPLVEQLRFTRSELVRCLEGIDAADAERRLLPNNSIAWTLGHLANHEHRWLVEAAQGRSVVEGLNERVGFGQPASTPPLDEMWQLWHRCTEAADRFLDGLDAEGLLGHLERDGQPFGENIGTSLQRVIYHYWFHLGEVHALRQQMGHRDLPEFVGGLGAQAPFRLP